MLTKICLQDFGVKIGVVSKYKGRSLSSLILEDTPSITKNVRIWDDKNDRTYTGDLVGYVESKAHIEVLLKDLIIKSLRR